MMSDASYVLDSSENVFHSKRNTVVEFLNKFHRTIPKVANKISFNETKSPTARFLKNLNHNH